MAGLIQNELYKLKREWFLMFLLGLSVLPVLTGGAGAVFNDSTRTLADLFFFVNNQFAMFFPMVIVILTGSLFYQEYKNQTYQGLIAYGYARSKLFLAKLIVAVLIGLAFAAFTLFLFALLAAVLQLSGKIEEGFSLQAVTAISCGFALEAAIVIPISACIGAIAIHTSRTIIVTSIIGVIYGFVSCFFIGAEYGYEVPGGFAYRIAMYFIDPTTYYEAAVQATTGGMICFTASFVVLLSTGLAIFTHKKTIE